MDDLSPEWICDRLKTRSIGRTMLSFATVGSTNSYAAELAERGAPNGLVVLSDEQTGGRGRLGRGWHSPRGTNLYASIVLRPSCSPSEIPSLSLVAGVAVVETIDAVLGKYVTVKWPNDVLVNGRKISGILLEAKTIVDTVDYVVLGMGINVNTERFPPPLDQSATSIRAERHGEPYARVEILTALLERFETHYETFLRSAFSTIVTAWKRYAPWMGTTISVQSAQGAITGRAYDLGPTGALLLELSDGTMQEIWAGDLCL